MTDRLGWDDVLLCRVAARLAGAGRDVVAEILIASTVSLEYVGSWSDGFDGYIHDVDITLGAPGGAGLDTSDATLREAVRDALSLFEDARGDRRRGDLRQLTVGPRTGPIDEQVIDRRRVEVRRHV